MTIKLTEPQADFVFSGYAHPAFIGGLGAGKSQAGTMRLIHLILQEPGIDVSHYFPSYRLAKRRGLDGTRKHLKALGIEHTVNKSDLTIFIPRFGSTIFLETYHDPEAIVSFEIAHAVIDELDTEDRERAALVWQKVVERTRTNCNHPVGNTVACVTTPNQGIAGFCFETWGNGERIADGYHYIKAGTRSNKFLPAGYADQIAKNYDPIMAEAFLDGGWVSFTENKVYHFFNRERHNTDRRIMPTDSVIHIGLDFNIGGCCAIAFVIDGINPVAVDEFVSYDTRDFVNNLTRYIGKKVIVYPDASGRSGHTNAAESDVSIIERAGYTVLAHDSNPAVRDRVNAVNGLLSHDRLKVNTTNCPNLTNALESQGYTVKGEPAKSDKHPAIDDYCDSLGYMIAYRFPVWNSGAGALYVSGGL